MLRTRYVLYCTRYSTECTVDREKKLSVTVAVVVRVSASCIEAYVSCRLHPCSTPRAVMYRHNYNRTVRLGTVPGTVMYSRVVLDDLTTPNLLFLYDTHSRSARLNATVTGG
jgi:hypothetical protein